MSLLEIHDLSVTFTAGAGAPAVEAVKPARSPDRGETWRWSGRAARESR
jgi:hypothetical protein